MDGADLEGLGQGKNTGIAADKLLLRIGKGLLKGGAGLKPHAAGDARLPGAHDVALVCSSARWPQLIMEKPWKGWKALAKRYLRMYSSLVAKYSPYRFMSGRMFM